MRRSADLRLEAFPRDQFARTWACLESGVSAGVAPGMVAGLFDTRSPESAWVASLGARRIAPSAQAMEVETVFDLASLTKIISTAALTASLVERGWLSWHSPVTNFFPRAHLQGIEIRHLLSHTAGFVAWRPFWEDLRRSFGPGELNAAELSAVPLAERQEKMRSLILAVVPEAKPGERCVYSDVSAMLMGFIIEEITGIPLDEAARTLLWQPWGLEGLDYFRTDGPGARALRDEIAATEACPWRKRVLQGQPHDDNCWAMGGYGGHAGVFGSVRDVLHFSRRLFAGALVERTLKDMWKRVSSPPGCERTMGWDTPSGDAPSVGSRFSAQTVGHLGFTGVSLWMDLEAGIAVSLLTNRVHPTRENNLIRDFRPRFHDAIRQDWDALRR
jgi:serine-type D-Ala-D-Ala carboxypeptidase